MTAGNYDIKSEQGSTFELTLSYKDSSDAVIDVSSKSARMQVRRSEYSTSKLLDITVGNVTGPSDVAGTGGITMNASGVTGDINVSVDATTMANVPSGRFFYDLELVDGTTITKLIKGRFSNDGEITR
jgi:hypothetical protein